MSTWIYSNLVLKFVKTEFSWIQMVSPSLFAMVKMSQDRIMYEEVRGTVEEARRLFCCDKSSHYLENTPSLQTTAAI